MLTIIHGDNLKASREFYFQLRQKIPNAKTLQGDKISLTDLVEAVEGNGLFAENHDVFVETLLTKKRSAKELDPFITYLTKNIDINTTLWEQKQVDKKMLKKFSKATIREFSFPQTLFQFLDALRPNNQKSLIHLYHQTVQTIEVEIILFMITKQIRLLLALKDTMQTTISEVNILQPWQRTKLEKQANLFTIAQLIRLHRELFRFDWGYKTGSLTYPLTDLLDFFLAEI